MRRCNSLTLPLFAAFACACYVDPSATDVTIVTPSDVLEEADVSEFTPITLPQVLADPKSFEDRKVEMNLRLGLSSFGIDDGCLDGNPCCGSLTWFVVFGDTNCPFEDVYAWDWRGRLRESGTQGIISYYGNGCAWNAPPSNLLGPDIAFEVGAEYTVRGTIELFWPTDGIPIPSDFLVDSIRKVGPRCPE